MLLKIYNRLKGLISGELHPENEVNKKTLIEDFAKLNQNNEVSKEFIKRKEQSLNDSQGVDNFSGSGYNAPGNIDREKTSSNMSQRNF